jgi:hypothetical protein
LEGGAVMTTKVTTAAEGMADLLVHAARQIPDVVKRAPVLTCDVHTAFLLAARDSMPSRGRNERLRLADSAIDQFILHLVSTGQAQAAARASQTLRGWLRQQTLSQVQHALVAAAWHSRQRGPRR